LGVQRRVAAVIKILHQISDRRETPPLRDACQSSMSLARNT
jgi:hypothetical protein